MDKYMLLTEALKMRQDEVLMYQINIDNYTMAIAEIGISDDPDLVEFKSRLEELLSSEKREQKKAQIIMQVIQKQLENVQLTNETN